MSADTWVLGTLIFLLILSWGIGATGALRLRDRIRKGDESYHRIDGALMAICAPLPLSACFFAVVATGRELNVETASLLLFVTAGGMAALSFVILMGGMIMGAIRR